MLEGRLSFLAGRKWSSAGPGETVVVPAGVRHAYRNKSDEMAHMVCDVRPPSTLQEFLEDAAALGRAGKLTKRGAFPKGFDALLQGGDGVPLPRHGRAAVPATTPHPAAADLPGPCAPGRAPRLPPRPVRGDRGVRRQRQTNLIWPPRLIAIAWHRDRERAQAAADLAEIARALCAEV
jgi:Cupin domain